MNSEIRNVLGEIDALAEKWDDHGAFDFLDEGSTRAEPKKRTSAWRRAARWVGRANLWWVPLAASIVVLLLAWQQANQAAEIERMNAAAAQELVEEKAAWQDLQKERIRAAVYGLQKRRAAEDYSEVLEYIDALESLEGWGRGPRESGDEMRALINDSRAEIAKKVLTALGYTDLAVMIEDGNQ